ncbi:MAG: DegT/DnrJ/EryC1/StrS aminotransferase family protein [Treponema sp.]|nr:DegT/DnrJ/EryC1/StrS aminotransferase family protein [Treponema sp.]
MISTFSSTIRRKEMDAVLTCMVDEKIGPGEMNSKLTQYVKEFLSASGCVAFRNPEIALSYAFKALNLEKGSRVLVSALAPSWHFSAVESLGFVPVVLDVSEETGLVTADIVQDAVGSGASALLFHESLGILPSSAEFSKILSLGIFVIEDVSHSVGSSIDLTEPDSSEDVSSAVVDESPESAEPEKKNQNAKKAGTFGVFSILGLEENDTVTGGGGAVLVAVNKREWAVLKNITERAPKSEILPDINSALAFVQLKEFSRNESARKTLFDLYRKALSGVSQKNRTFVRGPGDESTVWSFPVVLSGSFNDASQYAKRKEIELRKAYSGSVADYLLSKDEVDGSSADVPLHAKSLYLRTVLFPLYPRMNSENVTKITKVLATLP